VTDLPRPRVDDAAWIAPGAVVVGDVTLSAGVGIWYAAVLRGDLDAIVVGPESNIQDGCVVHTDPGFPVTVGRGVSVGHRAVLHGCTVEDDVLIGMGAVLLNGSRVGHGSLVAAGAVVLEGTAVPPNSLVAGVPGKIRRETTNAEREHIRTNGAAYLELRRRHAGG
jgi:carbonic anhydrase/acetyltransferase-like protein (isoleucine patch superfamily)